MTSPRTRRFPWLVVALSLPVLAVLLGLGTWQVERLAWKEALIETIDGRIHADPVPLADVTNDRRSIADQEYRHVSIAGTFEHAYERHFFATYEGESGFYVYTPLRLDDGAYLFVNRGFVPYGRKDPSTRLEGQVEGRVELTGLLREGLVEKPSMVVPDNDPAKNVFYWKDIRAMRETSGLPAEANVLGFFVDADDLPVAGGLPKGGVTLVDLPNNHLQYAITWYGLALALIGVVGAYILRTRRDGPAAS